MRGSMHVCVRVGLLSHQQVDAVVAKARVASEAWQRSSFAQRQHALKVILKFVLENQEQMARV